MKRITQRMPDGTIGVEIKREFAYIRNENGKMENVLEYAENPFELLAEYEDIGLTPQEIRDRIKSGTWIKEIGDETVKCSVCGSPAPYTTLREDQYCPPFCEVCGADMRG